MDNIYSVDLKSVVPTRGLTCVFAKATLDESNLWHRRLGHIIFKTMNKIVKVVIGNQTNGIAGSKENLVAGTKDSAVDAGKEAPDVDKSEASDNVGKNDQVPRSEVESLFQQERQTENINNTNSVNIVSSPVNIVGSSFVKAASQTPINAAESSARTNAFKEHSFE
nr:ribonuclease H-like domain-containing protein [Tanacetum cinerariifolium]